MTTRNTNFRRIVLSTLILSSIVSAAFLFIIKKYHPSQTINVSEELIKQEIKKDNMEKWELVRSAVVTVNNTVVPEAKLYKKGMCFFLRLPELSEGSKRTIYEYEYIISLKKKGVYSGADDGHVNWIEYHKQAYLPLDPTQGLNQLNTNAKAEGYICELDINYHKIDFGACNDPLIHVKW